MSGMTCDQARALMLDPECSTPDLAHRPDVAAHVAGCAGCQDWMHEFQRGVLAWADVPAVDFTEEVLARTSGLETVMRDLPLLADMDPGPGFAERVLLATSKNPAAAGWRARAAAAWWAMVRRPRFAWEAAYVATVCWVLVFGNPVGAIEWSAANIGTVARERLAPPVRELRADLDAWRATLAPPPASASGAAEGRGAVASSPADRLWEAAVDWLRRTSSSIVEAVARVWDAVAALAGDEPRTAAPATEPRDAPPRSRQ
jgi:hypothetical protein